MAHLDDEDGPCQGVLVIVVSGSAPVVQESFHLENVLLFCAGMAVGRTRLMTRVTQALLEDP